VVLRFLALKKKKYDEIIGKWQPNRNQFCQMKAVLFKKRVNVFLGNQHDSGRRNSTERPKDKGNQGLNIYLPLST
jgi:hypothetical protein